MTHLKPYFLQRKFASVLRVAGALPSGLPFRVTLVVVMRRQ